MRQHAYVLDTSEELERQRLAAQTELWDPFSCGILQKLGVEEGWRCLEVGGGTGSVADWLKERVGDRGRVVVTDIETRWLEPLAGPNLEVRRHDVVTDPLEPEAYDLVHTRLVLMHLPERKAVLAKLYESLRPGGWLVVEDYDLSFALISYPLNAAFTKVGLSLSAAFDAAGADASLGRKLPAALESLGLIDISADGRVFPQRTSEIRRYGLPVIERLRDELIDNGIASEAELDEVIRAIRDGDPSLWALSPILVSARGRRSRAG
jgi:SAM-dependent methyltransferase